MLVLEAYPSMARSTTDDRRAARAVAKRGRQSEAKVEASSEDGRAPRSLQDNEVRDSCPNFDDGELFLYRSEDFK
ncbi:hypothetical protein ACFX15_014021 [Malus domestica]